VTLPVREREREKFVQNIRKGRGIILDPYNRVVGQVLLTGQRFSGWLVALGGSLV